MRTVLGVPESAIYSVQAHIAALDALPPVRYDAQGFRVAYTLPDGTDVRVSPHAGAVPIVRWLTCGVDYPVTVSVARADAEDVDPLGWLDVLGQEEPEAEEAS